MPTPIAAAFFDVDKTILSINSGSEWVRFQYRRGMLGRLDVARAGVWALKYSFALLDMDTLAVKLAARERGGSEPAMRELCDRWWQDEIAPYVTRRAREALAHHRARGEKLALLTSGTQFLAEPMARDLGCDAALCSRLDHEGGTFTGDFARPLCFGKGKIHWAEAWAAKEGVSLAASHFYSDSYNDLPMLERVGHPVVVNPDLRLRLVAQRRGWRIERWD